MGLNLNCACVGDLCPMTPRTKIKHCRCNWFCCMSKISKGGSEMRNFTIFLGRSYERIKIAPVLSTKSLKLRAGSSC